MDRLDGQVAVVTGAGSGLGAEISRVLSMHGAWVVCADIKEERAQQVADEICAADGYASALAMDVSRAEEVAGGVRQIQESRGRIDILINNAAIDITLPIEELTEDDWSRIVGTNLSGAFWLSRAVFPGMKRQGKGQIVNIASTAAKRTWPNASGYHASKWGLLGLSHALHAEGRSHGIKVTAVISGGMRTPFLLDRFPDIDLKLLQDPRNVAETVYFVLTRPAETVIPEIMVMPMNETSWP